MYAAFVPHSAFYLIWEFKYKEHAQRFVAHFCDTAAVVSARKEGETASIPIFGR